MSINLSKGGRINLSKEAPSMKKVTIGLGWMPNTYATGEKFDLDASMFICANDANGDAKLVSDSHFVFYGNPSEPEGATKHTGDSRDGANNVDFGLDSTGKKIEVDEMIHIDLSKMTAAADELSFIVTIHDAPARKQNFGQIPKSVTPIRNDDTGEVLAKYDLEDDFSTETAVQFGSLYRKDGAWMFKAVGQGHNRGLADFVVAYGGNLA